MAQCVSFPNPQRIDKWTLNAIHALADYVHRVCGGEEGYEILTITDGVPQVGYPAFTLYTTRFRLAQCATQAQLIELCRVGYSPVGHFHDFVVGQEEHSLFLDVTLTGPPYERGG